MFGGGLARGLVKKAVAAAIAAGAGFVAIVALGATIFYALCLVVIPLGAAAITFGLFALMALIVTLVYLKGDSDDEEDDEPVGMGQRAFSLFRERPILGAVAALAGGWIFLRNPALATMVAAAFTEKSHGRRRY
ncbi:MAG: hypothetical protein DCF29_13365 [Alphaproteobacteria bacterium]|jgi:uncharacterized membrane protein|nr:MAG: hypothetical protein DCF29_13365 [Alphaproteobacteria bacterium]